MKSKQASSYKQFLQTVPTSSSYKQFLEPATNNNIKINEHNIIQLTKLTTGSDKPMWSWQGPRAPIIWYKPFIVSVSL